MRTCRSVLPIRSPRGESGWRGALAVAADLAQIVFLPALSEGFASPLYVVLDVAVAVALTLLVGWHIAFVPSFIIKALPFADLAPTWTAAVLFATRGRETK